MSGFFEGDLRTPEAVADWTYYKRNLERRQFRERQEKINWSEFARGAYQAAVNHGSRLVDHRREEKRAARASVPKNVPIF